MDLLQGLLTYMSPEQTGRTTYVPDHRSDIYSLGVVFYVLLTGKFPFEGGPLEILNGIVSRKMPLVNEIQLDVPEVVARIIEKMTNKSPDDRYNSAYGIRADLKECLKRLRIATESSQEIIESFPLAERDVASIFTLPKVIYGRQPLIGEMTYIIQHVANVYKSARLRKDRSHGSASTLPTITSADDLMRHQALSDSASEAGLSNPELSSLNTGTKSNASPSYCGSDISSGNGRIAAGKQGVEIICLSGPGGVGKSTLFNSVQSVARQEGYVASTKFDSRHKVPYSCILKSLSQILQQILSESEDDIHSFYNHLKTHLGSQFCKIELLADLVPELKPLLDPVDSEDSEDPINMIHLDNVETRVRFHTLFVEVFRALTQWRMVTLFLDDLHLADEPSIELIESMVGARVKLLIFLAYRDDEVTPRPARF
ncbi:Putative Serine/threonine protein kinase [Rhizopus microsporus]|nr:Putative Serine/threonine protein kinase [Rhizopus microsporus]